MKLKNGDANGHLLDQYTTQHYQHTLLASLNLNLNSHKQNTFNTTHPVQRWAESGLMSLTGAPGDRFHICPVPLVSCADATLMAFNFISGSQRTAHLDAGTLLAERAAIFGFQRQSDACLGERCRILTTLDGKIALNLARDSDWELLPAWLQQDLNHNWAEVSERVKYSTTHQLLEQGHLLGLALADADPPAVDQTRWYDLSHHGEARKPKHHSPTVVDLSSLWAGPLCSHLWQLAGATVIKVESPNRPDGARQNNANFYDLLNADKKSVCLDLSAKAGQQQLRQLILQADIVIEGSRPRALRQMGIFAEQLIKQKPGLTWLGISAYGRKQPQDNWIGYGDDTAVAAGLSSISAKVNSEWYFYGDAIADPLTGLHAAVAGWASWQNGGGVLIDVSLTQTVQHCISATAPAKGSYRQRLTDWQHYLQDNNIAVERPKARSSQCRAAALGADTHQYCP